jgi:hypothetical protein
MDGGGFLLNLHPPQQNTITQWPEMMVHDTFLALSMSGRDRSYLARTGDPFLDLAVRLHACLAIIR